MNSILLEEIAWRSYVEIEKANTASASMTNIESASDGKTKMLWMLK